MQKAHFFVEFDWRSVINVDHYFDVDLSDLGIVISVNIL